MCVTDVQAGGAGASRDDHRPAVFGQDQLTSHSQPRSPTEISTVNCLVDMRQGPADERDSAGPVAARGQGIYLRVWLVCVVRERQEGRLSCRVYAVMLREGGTIRTDVAVFFRGGVARASHSLFCATVCVCGNDVTGDLCEGVHPAIQPRVVCR